MAGGGADFTIRLIDQLSGPARRAAAAVERNTNALRAGASAGLIKAQADAQAARSAMAAASASGNYGQKLGAQVAAAQAAEKASMSVARLMAAEAVAMGQATRAASAHASALAQQKDRASALATELASMNRQFREQARWSQERAKSGADMRAKELADMNGAFRLNAQMVGSKSKLNAQRQKEANFIERVKQHSIEQQELAKLQAGYKTATPELPKTAGLKEEMFGAVTGATIFAGAIQKAIGLVVSLVQAVARLAIQFGKAVISSAMFLSQQQAGFAMIMGSAGAGAKELEWARKAAVEYGLSVEDTITQYKQLLGMKLGAEMSRDLIKMSADMQAFGLSSEQTSGVMRQLMQIMSKGKLQGEELMVLAENGISIDLIYKNLAKNLGKTVDEVRKMQAAGQLTSTDAMKAVQQTILEMTGGRQLGDAAKKAAETFAGSWNKVKAKVQDVLLGIGAKLLPVLEQKLMPMFDKLMAWFDSAEGKAFADSLVEGLTNVVDTIANLGKSLSAADVVGFVQGLITVVNGVAKAFAWLAENGTLVKFVLYAIGLVAGVLGAALAAIGAAIMAVAYPFYAIYQAIVDLWNALKAFWEWITSSLSSGSASFSASGQSMGASLVSGMVNGITGGASNVISAAVNMAMQALAGAKEVLGIASPSKAFNNIGANVAAGMAGGIEAGTPEVGSAAAGMLNPRAYGGRTTNTSVSAPTKVNISIPAAADPQATAAAVYATLETKLAGIFQDVALQVSVAGAAP